jgi:hypothetical protein
MPLYGMQPPTGYSMKSDAWLNSSALLGRMNFSLALMSGKISGVRVDADYLVKDGATASATTTVSPDSQRALAVLEGSLLAGDVSKQTHEAIARELETQAPSRAEKPPARSGDLPAPAPRVSAIAGLILGSPEFQKK